MKALILVGGEFGRRRDGGFAESVACSEEMGVVQSEGRWKVMVVGREARGGGDGVRRGVCKEGYAVIAGARWCVELDEDGSSEMGEELGSTFARPWGYGTRLRPLTFSQPKPLVDFANRPMIFHQIEALAKVGVKDVVLAVNYQPDVMVNAMNKVEEELKVKIHFSIEPEPLGTGGPLALARSILTKDDEPFFVLNSDVICEFPFAKLLAFHKNHGGEGTIMTTKVDDPSKFGVVLFKSGTTQIQKFVEKPKEFVGDQVNAGIYIFNISVLDRIPNKPTSIEKDVFPFMARDGQLHATPLEGFWADVGQPKDFLIGTGLFLKSLSHNASPLIAPASTPGIIGNVMIHETATVGKDCKIGPDVVIGPGVTIGNGVRLNRAVIMRGSTVKDNAWVKDSIVGWHSSVGRWARLDNTTVLGEDVHVSDEIFVNGGSVLPHKSVSSNILEPQIVMSSDKRDKLAAITFLSYAIGMRNADSSLSPICPQMLPLIPDLIKIVQTDSLFDSTRRKPMHSRLTGGATALYMDLVTSVFENAPSGSSMLEARKFAADLVEQISTFEDPFSFAGDALKSCAEAFRASGEDEDNASRVLWKTVQIHLNPRRPKPSVSTAKRYLDDVFRDKDIENRPQLITAALTLAFVSAGFEPDVLKRDIVAHDHLTTIAKLISFWSFHDAAGQNTLLSHFISFLTQHTGLSSDIEFALDPMLDMLSGNTTGKDDPTLAAVSKILSEVAVFAPGYVLNRVFQNLDSPVLVERETAVVALEQIVALSERIFEAGDSGKAKKLRNPTFEMVPGPTTVPKSPADIKLKAVSITPSESEELNVDRLLRVVKKWSESLDPREWPKIIPRLITKMYAFPKDTVIVRALREVCPTWKSAELRIVLNALGPLMKKQPVISAEDVSGSRVEEILYSRLSPLLLLKPLQDLYSDPGNEPEACRELIAELRARIESPQEFKDVRKVAADVLGHFPEAPLLEFLKLKLPDLVAKRQGELIIFYLFSCCSHMIYYGEKSRRILVEIIALALSVIVFEKELEVGCNGEALRKGCLETLSLAIRISTREIPLVTPLIEEVEDKIIDSTTTDLVRDKNLGRNALSSCQDQLKLYMACMEKSKLFKSK
ncbi:mannose-1-phosphate guanyltransferase [Phlyctochytrium bullatum]|nr:mannose-1-phosphate guanyltransferase [Phlyctochytrium bullatum]